jgi:eukaryotic-like serine/threonine-protein kinase
MGSFTPGSVFAGRYEILGMLGAGGMGSVYKARHVAMGKEVALKIMGVQIAADGIADDSAARFEREARAIAKLDHGSIVRILDYGRTRRNQFIAMQLLEGPTLAQVIDREGQLAPSRALQLTRHLLSALRHAHERGVLHRDLKPENVVLMGEPGRAVLIDFGLAHVDNEAALTARGFCVGSPSYLAPERLDGAKPDARADLYAVGVLLYEMLIGTRPFVGDSVGEILLACRTQPPRPLRAIRADVSKPLQAFVMRALAKDPDRRFASAEDMLAALEDIPVLEQLEVEAVASAREEQESTLYAMPMVEPTRWNRLLGWLRFGRWRWRTDA